MRGPILILAVLAAAVPADFVENADLWQSVDELNGTSAEALELEELFRRAVEIAQSPEIAEQFEALRNEAFSTGDDSLIESYVERAAPAITVLVLGESNNIGVNPEYFLSLAEPGTRDYEFFDLAMDGFFANGRPGTAELPVWMTRTGSSASAVTDPELAGIYAEIWEAMSIDFRGYYLTTAYETITALGGDAGLSESELQEYYLVYEDDYVMHLRSAFDGFLGGSGSGISQAGSAMDQLDKYRDYLSHRFVVLSLEASPMGGCTVLLISQERPDRIFEAWVYETAGGTKELRSFTESSMFSPGDVEEIAERYGEFLNDSRHCL